MSAQFLPEQKAVLKPFIWTVCGVLIYDIYVFSDAVLFDALDTRLWEPRGILAAVGVPLFILAAKRHPDWAKTLFISRQVVLYTATLTGVGVYLISMAIGGFVIRELGGQWGAAIQAGYLFAALGVLVFVLQSARLKTQLRVWISKHFFRNRYDYREEWLRLTRTLSDRDRVPLEQRGIKALCGIIDNSGGEPEQGRPIVARSFGQLRLRAVRCVAGAVSPRRAFGGITARALSPPNAMDHRHA